jgi:hypothetical protein
MPDVGYVCPGGDPAATDLANWGHRLLHEIEDCGHRTGFDLGLNSSDRAGCEEALAADVPLIFFFGHGSEDALLGSYGDVVIDDTNIDRAADKTLISIACEAGRHVGSAAVQAGVRAHLGWNVLLLWLARDADIYGESIVRSLSVLGRAGSVSDAADELHDALDGIALRYRPLIGRDHNAKIAYYAAAAAAGQVVIHGDGRVRPLDHGVRSIASRLWWRGTKLAGSIVAKTRGGKHV